ncbi:MAG: transporter, partial [Deltaproteobacteria bacterium]|nr:transporter [Deltaproteobacteria bacterium]
MKTRTIALLAAATVLALARPSWAQVEGFRADRFEMAPSVEDGFVLQGPDTLGHLRWNANVTLGLAATTLRVTPDEDTSDGFDVVGTRFSTYLGFAIGLLDRFEVDLQIPVALAQASEGGMQGGFAVQEAGSTALGDIRVGGSALLVGKKAEGFQLGATAMMTLPTGSEDDFNGDGSVGGLLTANAGYRAPSFRVVANAGVRLRSQADFVTSNQGHELIARGGVLVPLLDQKLTASAELDAQLRTGGDDSFDNVGSPFLGLLAARYNIGSGWHAGAGAGFGLTLAPGSPRYRLLATVGYMPETKKTPPPPPGPVDTDKD